ncbi:hypothetical protein TIFTF001_012545 [Ficus carica]|uniref:Uncharacterized protein n=1 Tax=Ficus carica TaxID=3494 RepID=A0AA88D6D7_FICCA|nr:hypothetical protein TIFTF001_012545 [Ficus carica]
MTMTTTEEEGECETAAGGVLKRGRNGGDDETVGLLGNQKIEIRNIPKLAHALQTFTLSREAAKTALNN